MITNPDIKISATGIQFIKRFEACRLKAYQDGGGVWTVGWGHTGPEVCRNYTILQIQADYTFGVELSRYEDELEQTVHVPLTQYQIDALCSLIHNIGFRAFRDSTLLRLLNTEDYKGAAAQFLRWNHDGGKVVDGLTNRRRAESQMFLKGVPNV